MGSFLGVGGLYLLWRRGEHPESDLALGALLPAFFWMAQGASFVFPGAEGLEAEFPGKVPRTKGLWLNERVPSALMLVVIAIGYVAERGRRA